MSRLMLAVADEDKEYTDSLSAYIMTFHSHRFRVHTFNDCDCLKKALSGADGFDILLVHESMLPDPETREKWGFVITLSDGPGGAGTPLSGSIGKYQPVEQLISQILALISDGNQEIHKGQDYKECARVFIFLSPAGGFCKTAAALCMALNGALAGGRVFYLGLDNIRTVERFFGGSSERGISDIIYYLKDNSMNLAFKIDTVKVVDGSTGIGYFGSPANLFDPGDILPDEFERLVKTLKYECGYDYLIVDMEAYGSRFLKIMPEADKLVIVPDTGISSVLECGQYVRDLTAICDTNSIGIKNRLTVLNSVDNPAPEGMKGFDVKMLPLPGLPAFISLPDIKNHIRPGTKFSCSISQLMEINAERGNHEF